MVIEKLLRSTENMQETIQILNSFNLNPTAQYNTERKNVDAPLDSQRGNKLVNLKGIKNYINSKKNINAKSTKAFILQKDKK